MFELVWRITFSRIIRITKQSDWKGNRWVSIFEAYNLVVSRELGGAVADGE